MNCKESLKEYIDEDEILKLSLKLSHDEITLYDFYEKIGDLRNIWQKTYKLSRKYKTLLYGAKNSLRIDFKILFVQQNKNIKYFKGKNTLDD